MTIYDLAQQTPDTWIDRHTHTLTLDQSEDLSEAGGRIKWCSVCKTHSSPNRPCDCDWER